MARGWAVSPPSGSPVQVKVRTAFHHSPRGVEQLIDGARLRGDLTAAARMSAGDPARRRAALALLKDALERGRVIARERLEQGGRGREIARLLAGVADTVIGALYDFTTVHVIRAGNPTEGERMAVVAVGGYGRGALAPFSDIDLLFLRPYKETAHGESVIEYMLYALWDLGFKIGHASRTITGCLKLARQDMTVRTALLDARPLAGSRPLSDELARRFRVEVVKGTAAEFIAAKLAERDERHARAGASRFLVEPNIKEGKGGLRDLHTLVWIARYLRPEWVGDPLEGAEVFDAAELRSAARAFDFFEAARAHLHFAAGRAEERLSFGVQPEIARRMGYHDRGRDPDDMTPGVERFMRRYFLIAADVGRLTRVLAARLEAERLKTPPRGLSRFLPRRRRHPPLAARGFHLEGGRLAIDGPAVFADDPVNLLRLFYLAGARDTDPHPSALAAASRALRLIDGGLRRDPLAARYFLAVLTGARDPARVLGLMNESGVLGRFLPEFGAIVGRTQFNMYHAYTVDEHSLRAVAEIAALLAGVLPGSDPEIVQAVRGVADREALLLAMLLHDTGKGGAGGQEAAGAIAARRVSERLGLSASRVDLVAWLVGHHLLMSDVAQKRDFTDPSTLAGFARVVATPERLRLLLAMTVADIRAVGPGVWSGWKAQLLRNLFRAAEAVLEDGGRAEIDSASRRRPEAVARAARASLGAEFGRNANRWASSLDEAYFAQFSPDEQRDHFALARRAAGAGAAVAVRARSDLGATEAVIVAQDRRGLFAELAGAIAAVGGDIAAARIFTRAESEGTNGQVLDIFHVRDSGGGAFAADRPRLAERLRTALTAAALGEAPAAAPAATLLARATAFAVPARVRIDNETSAAATVMEASGADRPGLLAALARACAEAGLSIQSAHADSLGERVVDAFYLVDENGAKVVDPLRLEALRASLLAVLVRAAPPAGRDRALSALAAPA